MLISFPILNQTLSVVSWYGACDIWDRPIIFSLGFPLLLFLLSFRPPYVSFCCNKKQGPFEVNICPKEYR
jgi:hypothetical protein